MNSKAKALSLLAGAGFIAGLAVSLVLTGCASSDPKTTRAPASPPPPPATTISAKAGPQLWSENCAHCHNTPSPNSYSDAQWDVAMMHMRVRANLTAEEHRKIFEFLKSAD